MVNMLITKVPQVVKTSDSVSRYSNLRNQSLKVFLFRLVEMFFIGPLDVATQKLENKWYLFCPVKELIKMQRIW